MNNEKEKEQSIDEMLINLDQILHQMENDELSLEETFAFYEQGGYNITVPASWLLWVTLACMCESLQAFLLPKKVSKGYVFDFHIFVEFA